jgi:hypothetical protein
MTWLVGGLALAFLAASIGLAIWIAKLKDDNAGMIKSMNEAKRRASLLKLNEQRYKREAEILNDQLKVLRTQHAKLLDKIQDGSLCGADGIADALRGML